MDEPDAALEFINGPRVGARITVSAGEVLLGRDVTGPGSLGDDPTLSGRHAMIRRSDDGQWTVEDLGSTNGTFLNSVALTKRTWLNQGDVLRVGGTELRWSLPKKTVVITPVPAVATVPYNSPSPAPSPAGDPGTGGDLASARELFGRRRYPEAAQSFAQLTSVPAVAVEAWYGMGVALLAQSLLEEADRAFILCLSLDRQQANALYQRGVIGERRGDLRAAQEYYRAAVAANPAHVSARRALERFSRPDESPKALPPERNERNDAVPAAALPGMEGGLPAQYGIYQYLRQDPSAISKQAIAMMDRLEMEVRPSFPAYIGHFLRGYIRTTFILLLSLTVVFPILALIIGFIRVRATRFKISQGRLQIKKGVLSKRLTNVDLWRVRNIELYRTFWNRMIGDNGTLIIVLSPEPAAGKTHHSKKRSRLDDQVEVTGLAKGSHLDEIFQQLLNLTFLLRGNPIVKGIIQ
jgi:pSer/pThr/pTyr-binding forkhead associated (FHA) protein